MNLNYTVRLYFKSFIAFNFLFLFTSIVFAQKQPVYEPQILILSPAKTSVSGALEKEYKAQSDTIARMVAKLVSKGDAQPKELGSQPQNVELMRQSSQAFITKMTFFKQVSYIANSYLTYRFYERFPNELILLKDTIVDSQLASLQRLSQNQQMSYILSFPSVELELENGKRVAKLNVQLYEQSSNSLLIDKVYTGDDRNPGFEFTCNDGTIGCTISNALSGVLSDVIRQIAEHNPTLIRQRELTDERAHDLQSNLYHQPYDATLVSQVIPVSDSSINLGILYQCLYNEDKTQFVAFFTQSGVKNSLKSLHDKADKGKVNIITSKDIHDPGYLNSIPQTYAYVVKGIKSKNKWYYQKDQITYFDAPTVEDARLMYLTKLEGWNYFKDGTSEYTPEFWNGPLFEKIADRKKDPKWERYKDMWETEELENRDYIGMYKMVTDQLKDMKKQEAEAYQKQISTTLLQPFFRQQENERLHHIIKHNTILEDFVLIYPKDRHVLLIPVKVTDDKGVTSVRYFVNLPGSSRVYEWTYFKPYISKGYVDDHINESLGSVTKWTFANTTLDDDNFWNNFVLIKQGNAYKYLTALN